MSLVAEYSSSEDSDDDTQEPPAVGEGPVRKKAKKLPTPDFNSEADVTIFKPAEEEPVHAAGVSEGSAPSRAGDSAHEQLQQEVVRAGQGGPREGQGEGQGREEQEE